MNINFILSCLILININFGKIKKNTNQILTKTDFICVLVLLLFFNNLFQIFKITFPIRISLSILY